MRVPYRKKLYQRTKRVLWGRIEVAAAVLGLLVLLSRPVMDYLLKLWEGLPWWVGVLILAGLLLYAFTRATYEEYRDIEQERDESATRLKAASREIEDLKVRNERLEAERAALNARLASVGLPTPPAAIKIEGAGRIINADISANISEGGEGAVVESQGVSYENLRMRENRRIMPQTDPQQGWWRQEIERAERERREHEARERGGSDEANPEEQSD